MFRVAVFLALSFFFAGSSSAQDAQKSNTQDFHQLKGTGFHKIYYKPIETVYHTIKDVIATDGLELVNDEKDKGALLAHGGVKESKWSENVAIFFDATSNDSTKVEIISTRPDSFKTSAKDWRPVLFEELNNKLVDAPITETPPKILPAFAQSIPTCNGEKDCLAKWEAAQLWVARHAGYKIQIATNVLIETYNSTGRSTDLAAQVTKEPLGGGKYQILIKLWCGYGVGCTPDVDTATFEFNQKINSTAP